MSASRTIQAASIPLLGQPLGNCFCTIYQLLFVVLASFFYIDMFSNHYFLNLSYSVPSSRLWGKLCTFSSTSLLHLILRVFWNQYQFNHLLLGLIVSRFGCIILLLASPANFTTSSTFSHFLHAHFSGFLTFHSNIKTKRKVFHIKSYFPLSSFAGKYSPRHSVLKGPWQFLFPVLTGLQVPVYKVKFVIGKFWPGGNYHQEAAIICSDLTMTHHRWRISIKLSPLQF